MEVSQGRFEALVADALDLIPDELAEAIENVHVSVEDRSHEDPELLGFYHGVPLTDREHYSGVMPDRIFIYRKPICAVCEDESEVVEQVRITVIHEVAHYFGIDDDRLEELGWD
ncbi:MAG: metallopeptidase family protein [Acidimicrobiia bacterium]|nr:metallopeptidase family protein [Acidimicrobiia bacterium]